MVNVVLGYDDKQAIKKMSDFLLQQVPSITTLLYTINQKWNDNISDLKTEIFFGKGFIIEKLEEFQFKISATIFFSNKHITG